MAGIRKNVSLNAKLTDTERNFIALVLWRNRGVAWTIWQRVIVDNVYWLFRVFNVRVLEVPGKTCDSDYDDVVFYTPGIRPQ